MYCNYAKGHTFLFMSTVYGQPKCRIMQGNLRMVGAVCVGNGGLAPFGVGLNGVGRWGLVRARFFSDVSCGKYEGSDGGGGVADRKTLPWISGYKEKAKTREGKVFDDKSSVGGCGFSWEESASRYFSRKSSKGVDGYDGVKRSSGFDEHEKIEKWKTKSREGKVFDDKPVMGGGGSSWEESAGRYFSRKRSKGVTGYERVEKSGGFDEPEKVEKWYSYNPNDEVEMVEGGEMVKDPRWDHTKSRYNRYMGGNSDRPEVKRWHNQENWGRKTWKEVSESTVPKMVGEGVYGVSPVLAALTVGRREFYALFIQENLDLSGNNRKKKDKKGIQKVLKIAEKIGLTVKETSKHDMNMVVDNRPHQGLVLDASPLEMVNIRELESISADEDRGPLWIALDEVTDPQNLGAIIRSAYFFGASGVVLCAKNSAPLSGIVSKASAGALELIELRSCKNMMQFLTSSGENGWRILGGSVSPKAVPLNEVETGKPTILVLGSEGTGLRPLVERSCTQLVRIPGNISVDPDEPQEDDQMDLGKEQISYVAVESLNVSVATGVLLYHLVGSSVSRGEIG